MPVKRLEGELPRCVENEQVDQRDIPLCDVEDTVSLAI